MSAAPIRSGRAIVLLALGLALRLAAPAAAHDIGVARAVLDEQADGRYVLEVELGSAPAEAFAPPRLPERCAYERAAGAARPDAAGMRYVFRCPGQPLRAGDVLHLPWQRQGVMIAARWQSGATERRFFTGGGAGIEVPLAALRAGSGSVADAARRYLALGVEHILLGIDHLLFVLGLLLVVRGPWLLVTTVTAFTLAHSLTLALATLGLVAVPSRPVEAAIALSIVVLAAEILRARQGRIGLTHRLPWLIAFVFGLLHGLGFAGALAEIGLPAGEIPLALLFFNLGVEIGQLMFIAAVLGLRWAMRRLAIAWPVWAEPLPAYAIGTIASFWFIEPDQRDRVRLVTARTARPRSTRAAACGGCPARRQTPIISRNTTGSSQLAGALRAAPPTQGRRPEKAVQRNQNAYWGTCNLPVALERRTVGLQELASGTPG